MGIFNAAKLREEESFPHRGRSKTEHMQLGQMRTIEPPPHDSAGATRRHYTFPITFGTLLAYHERRKCNIKRPENPDFSEL
jgi:hypothetical protein